MSLRASHTGELILSDCRIPRENILPASRGLGSPLACLNQARFGIAWGALGAAKACFDSALDYSRQRIQFGVPIASKQLIQAQLVEMALEISKGQLMNYHFARLKDRDRLSPYQVSMAKKIAWPRRSTLPVWRAPSTAPAVSHEFPVIRHMLWSRSTLMRGRRSTPGPRATWLANLSRWVHTYEGTDEVHTLPSLGPAGLNGSRR
jgi:glutaryl-CoA dehydrogenase